jgi:hypothetical protein
VKSTSNPPPASPKPVTSASPESIKPKPVDPEIEKLQKKMQQLELENQQLKSRKEKEANSEKMKPMSENDPLKNLTSLTLPVPSYQLKLLKEFAQKAEWEGCKVSVLEEEVVFYGVEQGCEEARHNFLIHMQVSY